MARVADHAIDRLFIERWSPRAMSGTPISVETLARLFEAARFAPSSSNAQPWRFLYARGGTASFQTFFELLNEGNKSFCIRAGALLVVLSKTIDDAGRPARTHSFDAGAAWMSFALQGSLLGLVVHGMAGFDYEKARNNLGIPDDYSVECMIAVGEHGRIEDLPERLRAREQPSGRKPITDFVFEGAFPSVTETR